MMSPTSFCEAALVILREGWALEHRKVNSVEATALKLFELGCTDLEVTGQVVWLTYEGVQYPFQVSELTQ